MNRPPRASAWAQQYIEPETEPVDVTPHDRRISAWHAERQAEHIALRNAHARSLRNRILNAIGSGLLAAIVPLAFWVAFPVAIGWAFVAGLSLYGVVVEQMATGITAEG